MSADMIAKMVLMLLNTSSGVERVRGKAGRALVSGFCMATGAGLGIAALVSAAIALWLYTEPLFGAAGAWLIVAGLLVVLALIAAFAIPAIIERRKPAPTATTAPPISDIAALLGDDAAKLFNNNKTMMLLAAFIGGMMAANERKK